MSENKLEDLKRKVEKTEVEWREQLDDQSYEVTRCGGTEQAFTGKYWDTKTDGVYHCVCCNQALFDSDTKYDSGSGWPSFYEALSPEAVDTRDDDSMMMRRVEVVCSGCEAHLGHVFPDGPQPTGLRFCMNSASLDLVEKG